VVWVVFIGDIGSNIVVIYEIKSFYLTLVVRFFLIYIKQITILPIVKKEKN
jgi:hypothetical protein